jgi:serine/threonine protein kinase
MDEFGDQLQAALTGAYRIERELGGGGMARVFVAEDLTLGRRVALKVLPPETAGVIDVDRFKREIQLAARLQQPFIVPLLSAGTSGGLLYYTMPLVEGESLHARLARMNQLSIDDTLRILRDVLAALSYAHKHGVVHRDVKPANVLLADEHALITDFGIAKALGSATASGPLTASGLAIGTPAYMAPEQAAGDGAINHRADLYAVGAMAYEMLAGVPPFRGATAALVMARQIREPAEPVTHHRPQVPAKLAELVGRLLLKTPADRPQSADEVLRALVQVAVTPDDSLDWLSRAADEHTLAVLDIGASPMFDGLHGHPEFKRILGKLGLRPQQ